MSRSQQRFGKVVRCAKCEDPATARIHIIPALGSGQLDVNVCEWHALELVTLIYGSSSGVKEWAVESIGQHIEGRIVNSSSDNCCLPASPLI